MNQRIDDKTIVLFTTHIFTPFGRSRSFQIPGAAFGMHLAILVRSGTAGANESVRPEGFGSAKMS